RRVEVHELIDARLLDIWQEAGEGRIRVRCGRGDRVDAVGRKAVVRVFEVVQGQANLLKVVLALSAGGRLADLLHRRQQQPDEHGDDGDHNEQFDQGEPAAALGRTVHRESLSRLTKVGK